MTLALILAYAAVVAMTILALFLAAVAYGTFRLLCKTDDDRVAEIQVRSTAMLIMSIGSVCAIIGAAGLARGFGL